MTIVEVFADVRCPFTHVGLRKLVERREAEGIDLVLRVRAWPLELVNGRPLDADLISEEVGQLKRTVAPNLFARFDPRGFPQSSLPALSLAAAAYEQDLRTGERVSLLLRDALYEEGRDISQPEELARIADQAGMLASGTLSEASRAWASTGPWRRLSLSSAFGERAGSWLPSWMRLCRHHHRCSGD